MNVCATRNILILLSITMHQIAPYDHYANGSNNCIRELTEIAPVITPIDNAHAMLIALGNGARGYIPTASTSLELTIEIIRLVRAGGTFVPASSFSLQMKKGEGSALRATSAEQFTPRQMAVLHYLKLGKANKIIAHELALSEGTVKAHIRNIMKKMGVTNRTEVACRAQTLATFAAT
jgi:DNA-binding NarL/FixJ family response regulator